VIDEASQCDIASALPLLFRAKAAVIIGDPKQLRHISAIPPRRDRELLHKHNLADGIRATITGRMQTSSNFPISTCRFLMPPNDPYSSQENGSEKWRWTTMRSPSALQTATSPAGAAGLLYTVLTWGPLMLLAPARLAAWLRRRFGPGRP
jgi:hypothetical protein